MLYQVLSQPTVFVCMACAGFLSGILFDIKNITLSFFKKKKILNQILLFFATFLTLFTCFYLNLKSNYGEIRFFSIFAFLLSFWIERFFSQNFLAKPISKCYNILKGKSDERKRSKTNTNDQ